jgi:ferritin-like metal-binding protein YciE
MHSTPCAKTLQDVLIEQISELYSVEIQFLQVLPKLAEAAFDQGLKAHFMEYQAQSKRYLAQLARTSELLGVPLAGDYESPMDLLIANLAPANTPPSVAADADLICGAYKVESYQKAGRVGICAFAQMLGCEELAEAVIAAESSRSAGCGG